MKIDVFGGHSELLIPGLLILRKPDGNEQAARRMNDPLNHGGMMEICNMQQIPPKHVSISQHSGEPSMRPELRKHRFLLLKTLSRPLSAGLAPPMHKEESEKT